METFFFEDSYTVSSTKSSKLENFAAHRFGSTRVVYL